MLTIIDAQVSNQIYNIAGNVELQNIEVIKKIIKLYNGDSDYEKYLHHMIRVGQDQRYSIDDSKLKKLGWQPQADFDKELVKIVQYYKENFIW
jgi:dTDP-D-glucose 4,6-dehydratase